MKITVTNQEAETFVKSAFENFPEASQGSSLQCVGWKYADFVFKFVDSETGKRYTVTLPMAVKAFKKVLKEVGDKKLFIGVDMANILDDGQWDSVGFDALAQMAVFGEVIYG